MSYNATIYAKDGGVSAAEIDYFFSSEEGRDVIAEIGIRLICCHQDDLLLWVFAPEFPADGIKEAIQKACPVHANSSAAYDHIFLEMNWLRNGLKKAYLRETARIATMGDPQCNVCRGFLSPIFHLATCTWDAGCIKCEGGVVVPNG